MTSRSGPGKSWGDSGLGVIVSERRRLIGLACRLFGAGPAEAHYRLLPGPLRITTMED
jgi:hypothetical protein